MAKTKPIGVRFDTEKLDFIKVREKLSSNQQVVDLLMNKYWWEHKIPVPTHKEAPPLALKEDAGISTKQIEKPENGFKSDSEPTYQELMEGMVNIHFMDDKNDYALKIQSAKNLKPKERERLLSSLFYKP